MARRVVITGMGAITPVGNTLPEYWKALISGHSGIDYISSFDTTGFSTKIAGQIKQFDPSLFFDFKEVRRTSKFILFAVAAATEAVKNSGIEIQQYPDRVGVEIGSGIGGLEVMEEMAYTLKEKGPSRVSPFTVPMMISDMASGMVAIKLGAKGPNSCSVTACASASHSIGNAFRLIQRGDVDVMIAGGSESAVCPLGLASFCAARSLSTFDGDPKKASRPFDANRDGFVMGEGAGVLILEDLDHALKRGATIHAELIGFGATGDAYHITAPAPEGEGGNRAMKLALKDAKLAPEDIEYINAHGTSTHLNDKNETEAIKFVFKKYAYQVPISSTKSMTGHLLGAAGAIELIACVKVITEGLIPPTINYETPDPECDLNYTPNVAIAKKINVAMSTSFGFGGHNAVLIVKKIS